MKNSFFIILFLLNKKRIFFSLTLESKSSPKISLRWISFFSWFNLKSIKILNFDVSIFFSFCISGIEIKSFFLVWFFWVCVLFWFWFWGFSFFSSLILSFSIFWLLILSWFCIFWVWFWVTGISFFLISCFPLSLS